MTDEDDTLRDVLAQDITTIEKYFEDRLEDKFELHGMTLVMLLFKAKIALLADLHNATKQAWSADQAAKDLIENLKRNSK